MCLGFLQVTLASGRRLDYQVNGATLEEEAGFVTLVRYSPDTPSGKATALFNTSSGALEVRTSINAYLCCETFGFLCCIIIKCLSTRVTNLQFGDIQVKPEESVPFVVLLSSVISISLVEMLGKSRPQMLKTGRSKARASKNEWGMNNIFSHVLCKPYNHEDILLILECCLGVAWSYSCNLHLCFTSAVNHCVNPVLAFSSILVVAEFVVFDVDHRCGNIRKAS